VSVPASDHRCVASVLTKFFYFRHRFVQVFFHEERLPIEEGWKRPAVATNSSTILALADRIDQNSGWESTGFNCPFIVLSPIGAAPNE